MLTKTLSNIIIDMERVKELETVSTDTKKQADVNHTFKQIVRELEKIMQKLRLSVDNSEFKPSSTVITKLKGYLAVCNKIVNDGVANKSTNDRIRDGLKNIDESIGNEWNDFFQKSTTNVISLLEMIKDIIPDSKKAIYAINKIKKAANWYNNTSVDKYDSMKQGLEDAKHIFKSLDLDKDLKILTFLKLVSEGSATIENLTDEILAWLKEKGIENKLLITFPK